jgi:hypothetical protein
MMEIICSNKIAKKSGFGNAVNKKKANLYQPLS